MQIFVLQPSLEHLERTLFVQRKFMKLIMFINKEFIDKIHARQCLYIQVYILGKDFQILRCMQKNHSCLILKQLGKMVQMVKITPPQIPTTQ